MPAVACSPGVVSPLYLFSVMVGMARCAVPARVAAGGTNIRATLAFEGITPPHAARTSQRDVPTTLNTYLDEVRQAALKDGDSEIEHRIVRNQEMNFLFTAAKQPKPMLIKSMVEPASGTVGMP